jgi:hypothetical protein
MVTGILLGNNLGDAQQFRGRARQAAMVRPDLHRPPSFVAWLAPYLAAFSRRTRSTAAALAVGLGLAA